MDSNINWENKLLSFGIPQNIANRMASSLVSIPYDSSQFSSIQQLVPIMESHNFQSLDWWSDFEMWLQEFMDILMQISIPGVILTAVGGVLTYALRNVKVKNIPIGLVGLVPMGYGLWMIMQPFLPQEGG